MEENKNQDTSEPQVEEQPTEIAEQPASKLVFIQKFEMPSWFALLLTFGLYVCSAMLIMAVSVTA